MHFPLTRYRRTPVERTSTKSKSTGFRALASMSIKTSPTTVRYRAPPSCTPPHFRTRPMVSSSPCYPTK
ncbi:hypothetical protein K437DRAFT_260432 [Tilletiaria anomala UBC 951]|uniref:Uncharacterized protein n=1 Tax=Tilletiaria anomala (strain ATCC 24038 / CBS 436.72 / UBC 951) TaxID=1037660 RepID=A0A066V3K1_TILAU|nr:uncharacterized protein K437DRAFT_260432 [Tilletiaria anomala UBC 951]KDN34808.1 hypothetical protein K437DRAFT_260432 [Tilletiaria anomala UBC 951]